MDLRQFERIERPQTRHAEAPLRAAPRGRVPREPIGRPGAGWLIGWVFLVWFVLVVAGACSIPIYPLISPDIESLRGFPGTEEWLRSSLVWYLRWGVTHTLVGALNGFFIGGALWLMLRSRVPRAAMLPLAGALGLAIGSAVGYGISAFVAVSGSGALFLANPDLFLLRQIAIVASVGGAGFVVAAAFVLQPRLPGYGWWAGACVVGFLAESLAGPVAFILGAGTAGVGAAAVFVGLPVFALVTGIASFFALRTLGRGDFPTEDCGGQPGAALSVNETA